MAVSTKPATGEGNNGGGGAGSGNEFFTSAVLTVSSEIQAKYLTDEAETTPADGPGFGIPVSLLALLTVALWGGSWR